MRILTAIAFSALFSAPVLAADLGMYRPGTPYSSTVAPGADVCESHCAGDAQCRGWNFVKPNPRVSGVCEFLSSVSTPIASQISISGEGFGDSSFSSRVSAGSTNTVRVGTQVTPRSNTVTVGRSEPGRRIVREATPQRIVPQAASTGRPSSAGLDPMSLTAQQNRYRQQGHPQPRQQVQPRPQTQQRPAFRPILDGSMQARPQQQPRQQMPFRQQQQPQYDPRAQQQSRRMTGPRRGGVPQQQSRPQQMPTRQAAVSRPPVGQPIPAPQNMSRRSVVAPQSAPPRQVHNPVALAPEQAQKSLYGRLNDDVRTAPPSSSLPTDMPIATAVPAVPVQTEAMETLAGGR